MPAPFQRHVWVSPRWLCRACAAPWPCQPAKLRLRIEYDGDPVGLTVYLSGLMHQAAGDLRGDPAAPELYRRFVGWARRGAGD